ncbi:hypothetical protein CEXT_201231 [Caerostris extrusa]|uniref:Uncharacterized protein n=1 Tax=Caerostris extrusa TaxID=172846 RepID=A0AAV4NHH4_CAEEX|nr:hypothetical protein CEXT_201231 [Caerostris extrusa]
MEIPREGRPLRNRCPFASPTPSYVPERTALRHVMLQRMSHPQDNPYAIERAPGKGEGGIFLPLFLLDSDFRTWAGSPLKLLSTFFVKVLTSAVRCVGVRGQYCCMGPACIRFLFRAMNNLNALCEVSHALCRNENEHGNFVLLVHLNF